MRMRLSLATWTNGNANRFDLLGVPRLAAVAPDARYVDPDVPPGAWGRYFDPSALKTGIGAATPATPIFSWVLKIVRGDRGNHSGSTDPAAPGRVRAYAPGGRRGAGGHVAGNRTGDLHQAH